MNWVMAGALWGLVGVGLGAFGAHGLKSIATEQGLEWWETAARYQLIHAVALVLLGLLQHHRGQPRAGPDLQVEGALPGLADGADDTPVRVVVTELLTRHGHLAYEPPAPPPTSASLPRALGRRRQPSRVPPVSLRPSTNGRVAV